MKTVRRLYFYAVALTSIEVVLWGLVRLLRSIVDQTVGGTAEALAQSIALILVGLPIFLFHWLWVQRLAATDEDEKNAGLRAFFFYAILIGTLIPLIQNLLSLVNRTLLDIFGLHPSLAVWGGSQSAPDNLIAILMNGLVALYFWTILRGEWPALTASGSKTFADVRRLYRYVWVIYGLLMTIIGAQQILHFLFYVPSEVLGDVTRETFVNGLSLLVIGAPIWIYAWRVVQDSLGQLAERDSNLRLGILYILALGGVISVLTTTAMVVYVVLTWLLGSVMSTADFVHQIGGPISVGLPLGAVWAYYGHWLNRHIETIADPIRQSGMKRVYYYILSALGLGSAFAGVAFLIKFIIDVTTGGAIALDDVKRQALAGAVSLIVAWLPLWLLTWRPLQAQASETSDQGDHARRSIVRRFYLYLALFAGVIGGMVAAVALIFQLLNSVLTGRTASTFLTSTLNDLQVLILFAILLVYHLTVLRRDGRSAAAALARRQSEFKVLVVDSGKAGFGEAVQAALTKAAPNVQVTVSAKKPAGAFNALVMSGSEAVDAPDWIRSFKGRRIIVPDEAQGLIWAGGVNANAVQQAALNVRQLAEGQEVRQTSGGSGWMVVVYVAAALFAAELLFTLVMLVVSTFMR